MPPVVNFNPDHAVDDNLGGVGGSDGGGHLRRPEHQLKLVMPHPVAHFKSEMWFCRLENHEKARSRHALCTPSRGTFQMLKRM